MDITLERILSLIPKKSDGKFVHGAKTKFARSIGLAGGSSVAEWEAGRSASYHHYLYAIAAKYNVSVEWLRGETDEKSPPSKDDGLEAMIVTDKELIHILKVMQRQPDFRKSVYLQAGIIEKADGDNHD